MRPAEITLERRAQELVIRWEDGRLCRYPWGALREACPCVACRGGHQFMGAAHEPQNLLELKPSRSWQMTDIALVGNYALQPTWDDGHATGIYSWELLRRLCPSAYAGD